MAGYQVSPWRAGVIARAWHKAFTVGRVGYFTAEQYVLQKRVGRVAGRVLSRCSPNSGASK
jgi:hypothetical protein